MVVSDGHGTSSSKALAGGSPYKVEGSDVNLLGLGFRQSGEQPCSNVPVTQPLGARVKLRCEADCYRATTTALAFVLTLVFLAVSGCSVYRTVNFRLDSPVNMDRLVNNPTNGLPDIHLGLANAVMTLAAQAADRSFHCIPLKSKRNWRKEPLRSRYGTHRRKGALGYLHPKGPTSAKPLILLLLVRS